MLCVISGEFRTPNGVLHAGVTVKFKRSAGVHAAVIPSGAAVIVPDEVAMTTNVSGVGTVSLYPGRYQVELLGSNDQAYRFLVNVPQLASTTFSALLSAAPEYDVIQPLNSFMDLVAQAGASRVAAEAAEAAAETAATSADADAAAALVARNDAVAAATGANGSATAAQAARVAAEAARDTATTRAGEATTAATTATGAAGTATTKAAEASASADAAAAAAAGINPSAFVSVTGDQTVTGRKTMTLVRGPLLNPAWAATMTLDFAAGNRWTRVLAGATTMANPTNMVPGQSILLDLVQDATGGRLVAWGSFWKFPGGIAPVLSTAPGRRDVIVGEVISATEILCGVLADVR